ncbi:Flp family type IVb pilin [Aurantimonas sp. VKM B-3413]|uniref:Flp family type IVb pilin n=1 Tax=Aurantimonas sp. VKM B-3413 TaxID=2779401 RepID=UPI001E4F1DB3|nr:hypothetical protein [Aurantimonas sp. VKM B-3413]MCB8837338.1 hypothetical protein [Aurantimonas sp. VKM B-3413]
MLTAAPSQQVFLSRLRATGIRFLRCDRGTTSIEYSVIAMVLGVAIVAALGSLEEPMATAFAAISAAFSPN